MCCANQDQKEITKFKPYTGWGEAKPIQASSLRFALKKKPFPLLPCCYFSTQMFLELV